jgi:hypothetical protein
MVQGNRVSARFKQGRANNEGSGEAIVGAIVETAKAALKSFVTRAPGVSAPGVSV